MGSLSFSQPNLHDTMISYLPLAHMFERMLEVRENCVVFVCLHRLGRKVTRFFYLLIVKLFVQTIVYMVGGRVGFYRGDVRVLAEDLQELRPTLVPTVPRVLNRIYDKVMQEVGKSSLKKYLVNWAVSSKSEELKKYRTSK